MSRHFLLGSTHSFAGDEKHAKKLIEDGLALAREIGDSEFIGLGLLLLVECELDAQNYLRARELGDQALGFLEQIGNPSQVCTALSAIGRCEQALGNLDEAYSYLEKALALGRQLEETIHISSNLLELFTLDLRADRLESAEERVREYEKIAQLTGDPFKKGVALSTRAQLLLVTSGFEAAKRYVLAAVSHFEKAGLPAEAVEAREGLVDVAEELNDLPLQEEQLAAIVSALSDFGNDERTAFAFYRLGLVQEELNKPVDAEASYEEALSLYSSLGMLDDPIAEEMTERLERIRTQLT